MDGADVRAGGRAALDAAADHPSLRAAPIGTQVRRPGPDDFAAVLALHRRVAATGGDGRPGPGALRSEDELRELWEQARGDAVLVEVDGTVVGYADFQELLDPWTPALELHVEGRVDAAHRDRGIGQFLLDRAIDRAARAATRAPHLPTELRTTLVDPHEDAVPWFTARGFRPVRHVLQLRLDLTGDLPAPTWPDGVDELAWQAAAPRSVHRALRAAFADHHLGVTEDYDTWRVLALAGQRVHPQASVLARGADGRLAGVALGRVEGSLDPGLAVITELGVVPGQRGRGVATALLRASFRRLRDVGATRVGLEVDDVTLDGALRLYERAGMEVVHRTVQLARPVRTD